MNWNDVRVGDTVKVKHKNGATIEGSVVSLNGASVHVSGLYFHVSSLEIIEHTPGYKDGDIVVFASPITGTWVGIYDSEERMFYDNSEEDNRTPLFSGYDSENITIVGNIKELA